MAASAPRWTPDQAWDWWNEQPWVDFDLGPQPDPHLGRHNSVWVQSRRTQTHYPWSSWLDPEPQPEPEVWFHDLLRPDGSPHDPAEAAFRRALLRS